MEKVNRDALLQRLEAVAPGLDKKGGVEQSDCFVFDAGQVLTFNDEVACSIESPLNGFRGAVKSKALLEILGKLPEDDLTVEHQDGALVIKGVRRRLGVVCEAEIMLPIAELKLPADDDWGPLPVEFCEAVGIVRSCAARDDQKWLLTCVHIHPDWVEACDETQLARYTFSTLMPESVLVRASSIKHIVELGMLEFALTKDWIHFRNAAGLVLSCRRQMGVSEYPNLSDLTKVTGQRAILPRGISESVEKAKVFSADNVDSDYVEIALQPGKLKISGRGASGWYEELKQISYDGPRMSFMISPKLLIELVEKANECQLADGLVIVDGGRFKYVASLKIV